MRIQLLLILFMLSSQSAVASEANEEQYKDIQRVLNLFCMDCHSLEKKEGELDLQRFDSIQKVRADLKPWQAMILQLESREMPPKDHPQPTESQRQQLIDWSNEILRQEAIKRAGDPGKVLLHRLSNTEYNNTIRDLTGVDLRPAKTFPADGAAGEGFTNAAEALSMSPAMMSKYIQAAREISQHAVLLPDSFRFSPSSTKRDWTDENLAELRKFYRQFTYEGSLPLKPYIAALVEHREELVANRTSFAEVANQRNLSPKYFGILWEALNTEQPNYPMNRVCELWNENNVDGLVTEVSRTFDQLWEYPRIGSYVNTHRQKAKVPAVQTSQSLTIIPEIVPGQSDVTLYLRSCNLGSGSTTVRFVMPRFQNADGTILKLHDYQNYGPHYEIDIAQLFANTNAYLNAAVEGANDATLTSGALAKKHKIDAKWLVRWRSVLNTPAMKESVKPQEPGRKVLPIQMQLLDDLETNPEYKSINGWHPKGADLPIVISNLSDKTEHVPGRVSPHTVAVHPMPTEFVATVWKSPMTGRVQLSGKVAHAHPACGNGVRWWTEIQSKNSSAVLLEGAVDLGREARFSSEEIAVQKGDRILLAIDARDANHVCDLTEVTFTITEVIDSQPREWDLSQDVANDITNGNPNSDRLGNAEVWSFVKGKSKDRPPASTAELDDHSLLARWRRAVATAGQQTEAAHYAKQLQSLLTGDRPSEANAANRKLYDLFVALDGPLLRGIDLKQASLSSHPLSEQSDSESSKYGLKAEMFLGDDLVFSSGEVVPVCLPTALFRDYQFVVDCQLDNGDEHSAVQFQVATTNSNGELYYDSRSPVILSEASGVREGFLACLSEFRRIFPPNICYPHVIPLDEVVCLKTFHREDQPLIDLFLDAVQETELERLWDEHRFITKFPIVENEYLPLFIGFVTQDQPQELVELFQGKRPEFQQRAENFTLEFEAAANAQLQQLEEFAAQAYRRPLLESERNRLYELYHSLRNKKIGHEEAFRSVIARLLMAPSFLLHVRNGAASEAVASAVPLNDWELASRLSYFLWSSIPDAELRQVASTGMLKQPEVLNAQVRRMLRDERIRSLAVEFGTQWIHVRGFDEFNEKNETLFPMFDHNLRSAMYEEAITFFQHLFRENRPASDILDANYTFINERLAQHYSIPNIQGDQTQRIDNVKQFGRGGILGFAAVQSKQAGASRTSPILRGNWVVETLLGEKLPLPPPNVPQLPEQVDVTQGLTMRQLNERHVKDEACAVCHRRIDPFGYSLENYDAVGRLRQRDSNNLPIDAHAKVRDGSEFAGIDGLRNYLLTQKQDVIQRLFCQRLLGYALGRTSTISDQILLDAMSKQLETGGVADVVVLIVKSPQFQNLRSPDFEESQ